MKTLVKMKTQMFCKFHFFPMVKFSRVQLSFTKLTVVTIKKKVVLKCPNEFQRESFPAFRKEAAEESNFICSFRFPDSSFGVH